MCVLLVPGVKEREREGGLREMNWRSRGFRPRKKDTGNGGGATDEAAAGSAGQNGDAHGHGSGVAAPSTSAAGGSGSSSSAGGHLRHHIDATLGSGNLRAAVKLPAGEDYDEWLAVNTVDFYNAINLLYGLVAEFCTEVCVCHSRIVVVVWKCTHTHTHTHRERERERSTDECAPPFPPEAHGTPRDIEFRRADAPQRRMYKALLRYIQEQRKNPGTHRQDDVYID